MLYSADSNSSVEGVISINIVIIYYYYYYYYYYYTKTKKVTIL